MLCSYWFLSPSGHYSTVNMTPLFRWLLSGLVTLVVWLFWLSTATHVTIHAALFPAYLVIALGVRVRILNLYKHLVKLRLIF